MNDRGYMAEASSMFPLSYKQTYDDKEVKAASYKSALANFR